MKDIVKEIVDRIEMRASKLEAEVRNPVVDLTDENFTEFISKHKVAVILFTAAWCHPCKAYDPLFRIVARRVLNDKRLRSKDIAFGRVDTDAYPHLADKYNIDRVPSTVIYVKGHAADVIVGAVTEDELVKRIMEFVERVD